VTLRLTQLLLADDGEVIELRFYVTDQLLSRGLWNIDTNEILLTPPMFAEWEALRKQSPRLQKLFLAQLLQISGQLLG
jgi:hypothetical protein